jgi:hypothetical protein
VGNRDDQGTEVVKGGRVTTTGGPKQSTVLSHVWETDRRREVPSRRMGVFWQKVSFWRFFFFFGGKKKHLKSLAKPYQSLFGVLNMVDKIVTACVGVGSSKPTASLVAAAEHGYRTVLYAYLAEKENIVLPVLRAFFKPQEVFAGEFPSKSQTVCPYSYQKGLLPLHIQDF